MSKTNKMSVNKIDKLLSSITLHQLSLEYEVDGETVTVQVANDISIAMRGQMVKDIVNMVFVEDENKVKTYVPYLKKFASRYCVLAYFTDINLPTSTDKIWAMIEYTTIYDDVVGKVGKQLIDEILAEADEMIAFEKATMLKNTKIDSLFEGLNALVANLTAQLKDTDLKGLIANLQSQSPKVKDGIMDAVLKLRDDGQVQQASNSTNAN